MRETTLAAVAASLLVLAVPAQDPAPKPQDPKPKPAEQKVVDDFQREGNAAARAKKDPLEGKAPPPLQVAQWMNIEGKALTFDELKGKVVAIKFWGVW